MKTMDVTALGELLVDFTESGISPGGNILLEANPGGAPCNVLAMLRKLGKNGAFIGKVGQDTFGDMLEETLKNVRIGPSKSWLILSSVHWLSSASTAVSWNPATMS